MSIFVLFNYGINYIALFWPCLRIRKIQIPRPRMEAPLAIRAWTLLYSRDKALAEPEDKIMTIVRASFLYPRIYIRVYNE